VGASRADQAAIATDEVTYEGAHFLAVQADAIERALLVDAD